MKIKSPIKRLKRKQIITTLPFADKTYAQQYKEQGWGIIGHNGEDYVCSAVPVETYGVPIIASQDGTVVATWFDNEMSTKGNGVKIQGLPFVGRDGKKRMLYTLYWHLAEVNCKAGDFVKVGQELGTMGNTGYIIGSGSTPYKGTHLHFGVYQYVEINGQWFTEFQNNGYGGAVNPSNWLEEDWKEKAPEIDSVSGEEKLYPLKWALDKIAEQLKVLSQKVVDFLKRK